MSKLKSLSEALDGVEDGATIGIGGWISIHSRWRWYAS